MASDQFARYNREQNSRNSGGDASDMKGDVGGSMKMRQVTPKEKQFPANADNISKLKGVMSGRPDTAKPSKTVV